VGLFKTFSDATIEATKEHRFFTFGIRENVEEMQNLDKGLQDLKAEIGAGLIPIMIRLKEIIYDVAAGWAHMLGLTDASKVMKLEARIAKLNKELEGSKIRDAVLEGTAEPNKKELKV
jgi:hypothetical protein